MITLCQEVHQPPLADHILVCERVREHFGYHQVIADSHHAIWADNGFCGFTARPFEGTRLTVCVECELVINDEVTRCESCDFWNNQRLKSDLIIIDSSSYRIGQPGGFDGAKFTIKFFTGQVIITNKLWFVGKIPSHFLDSFEDNAVFVEN